jgi:SAM-dependent methyltransferase
MAGPDLYASPRPVTSVESCDFYHTIDLPGHGHINGAWDLRAGIDRYLGHTRFAGKRVLDVGTASGFLTFHMERQGAEVVSYDLSPDHRWDVVPFAGADLGRLQRGARRNVRRYNNGYWLCHRALRSRARMVYGTAYAIPATIGHVDVATCGCILLHLRDPFRALENVCRVTRETVVVTDLVPRRRLGQWLLARLLGGWGTWLLGGRPQFLPAVSRRGHGDCAWWELPPAVVCQMLGVLGFEDARVTYHTQLFEGSRRLLFTVAGRRTHEVPVPVTWHPPEGARARRRTQRRPGALLAQT